MSIQSEVETRMRQKFKYDPEYKGWYSDMLRERFLPDDFSKLSWDFIRQFKDQFTPADWNAIWNYHTTHEKQQREFRPYFEKYGNRKYGYPNSYEYNQKELYKNRHGKEMWE